MARKAWQKDVHRAWDRAARGWEYWDPLLMGSMRAVDPALQRALELRPGLRLLDAGCGLGEPALSFAPLLSPRGRVLGVDLSRSMIEAARRRARAMGVRNVTFRAGDMRRLDSRLRFDRIVSRYGIMFAEEPAALLARLRHHLRPGGRIAVAVWGPPSRNIYFAAVAAALRPVLRDAMPDPEHTPHPLRFARVRRLTGLMRAAGFRDVRHTGVRSPFTFQTPEQYADLVLDVSGSTRQALADAGPRAIARVRRHMIAAARRHRSGSVVRLPGFAWVVSARR